MYSKNFSLKNYQYVYYFKNTKMFSHTKKFLYELDGMKTRSL